MRATTLIPSHAQKRLPLPSLKDSQKKMYLILWSPPLAEGFSPNPEEVTEEGQIQWNLGKTDICRAQHPRLGTEEGPVTTR